MDFAVRDELCERCDEQLSSFSNRQDEVPRVSARNCHDDLRLVVAYLDGNEPVPSTFDQYLNLKPRLGMIKNQTHTETTSIYAYPPHTTIRLGRPQQQDRRQQHGLARTNPQILIVDIQAILSPQITSCRNRSPSYLVGCSLTISRNRSRIRTLWN